MKSFNVVNTMLLFIVMSVILPGRASAAEIEVLWLGHAATRITSVEGKVIVIDPFLSKNPKTPEKYKDLKALGKVDLILITHGHGDHIGDVSELAKLTGAKVVANAELVKQMAALAWLDAKKIVGMNKSGMVSPLGDKIKIHMVPAEHSSSLDIGKQANGGAQIVDAGAPVGYVVELENGFKIYHSGDTGVFGDMALIGKLYKPDVAMICIGGHYTMDGEQAAFAMTELVKPKKIIPIHYGTFPALYGTVAQLKKALGKSAIEVVDIKPGEAVRF